MRDSTGSIGVAKGLLIHEPAHGSEGGANPVRALINLSQVLSGHATACEVVALEQLDHGVSLVSNRPDCEGCKLWLQLILELKQGVEIF